MLGRCRRRPARAAGFTLVELVVVLAVAAVLLVMAVPSFTLVMNTNRLAALSNDVIASLQTARMEAVRRGVRVVICNSANGTSCTNSTSWTGWVVFADANADGAPQATEIIRAETVKAPLQLLASANIAGDSNRITFRSDGFAHRNDGTLLAGQLAVCLPVTQPKENVRLVYLASGSRIALRRRDAGGACTAPSNS